MVVSIKQRRKESMKYSSIHHYIFMSIGFFSMKENVAQQPFPVESVVLAAGRSTRFAMPTSKLAFPLCGREMVLYPISVLDQLGIPTIVVTGYQKEDIIKLLQENSHQPLTFVEQLEQRGTGHAVMCAQPHWKADHILIINGDMPLITADLIQDLITQHCAHQAAVTFVTAQCTEYPNGYGKVISDKRGIQIIEARDFTGSNDEGRLINAGIYIIERRFLEEALAHLVIHENSQELYITDVVAYAYLTGEKIHTVETDFTTIRGVNTIQELATTEKIIRERIIHYWMKKGVYFEQPETTVIEQDVSLGAGTRIGAGVHITKGSRIGVRCVIGHYSCIARSALADQVTILPHCVISDSEINDHASIGPFAHLRNVHSIHHKATIGNFVEVSNSTIGAYSKVKHLSYIGNATIGEKVNIGAGTITCNYDGTRKHITTIEDGVKVGSNNCLIAPVTLGKNSLTGAGSVITRDVPAFALGIARAQQVNKENYTQQLTPASSFVGAQVDPQSPQEK